MLIVTYYLSWLWWLW